MPVGNLLGEEGKGFGYLMHQLAQERLMVATRSPVVMEAMLEETVNYTRNRKAFGQAILTIRPRASNWLRSRPRRQPAAYSWITALRCISTS